MEVRNTAAWSYNILETHFPTEPILACPGSWLQPQYQPKRNWTGCCYTLQWKHETVAWDKFSQVPRLLDKVCWLQSCVFTRMQHQSIEGSGGMCRAWNLFKAFMIIFYTFSSLYGKRSQAKIKSMKCVCSFPLAVWLRNVNETKRIVVMLSLRVGPMLRCE